MNLKELYQFRPDIERYKKRLLSHAPEDIDECIMVELILWIDRLEDALEGEEEQEN